MKAFLIGMTIIFLFAPPVLQSTSAQDVDPQCSTMRDKVACTCALQNGGRIVQQVENKQQRWWARRRLARQSSQPLDREKIEFPIKFRRVGWKLRPSPAVEGYLACMRAHGRK